MSSFLNFVSKAADIMGEVLGALGGGSDGCIFTLSGDAYSVSFPVSPPDFEVANPYNNQTVNIQSLGDINMLGKRGLQSIKFSSFFPAQAYTFVQVMSLASPYEYVNQVKKMAESGKPCHLSITDTDVSVPVSIDDFTYKEQDGTGDVYFSLTLREYRYIMPESSVTNDATGLKSRVAQLTTDKQTTCLGTTMAGLDTAQRAIQKTTTIAAQGKRVIGLYKAMVKSGGIPVGTILTTTAKAVQTGGKSLYTF